MTLWNDGENALPSVYFSIWTQSHRLFLIYEFIREFFPYKLEVTGFSKTNLLKIVEKISGQSFVNLPELVFVYQHPKFGISFTRISTKFYIPRLFLRMLLNYNRWSQSGGSLLKLTICIFVSNDKTTHSSYLLEVHTTSADFLFDVVFTNGFFIGNKKRFYERVAFQSHV